MMEFSARANVQTALPHQAMDGTALSDGMFYTHTACALTRVRWFLTEECFDACSPRDIQDIGWDPCQITSSLWMHTNPSLIPTVFDAATHGLPFPYQSLSMRQVVWH